MGPRLPGASGARLLGARELTVSIVTSGLIIATLLVAGTLSMAVAVTTTIASLACGAVAFFTGRFSASCGTCAWLVRYISGLTAWIEMFGRPSVAMCTVRLRPLGIGSTARCRNATHRSEKTLNLGGEGPQPERPLRGIPLALVFSALLGSLTLVVVQPRLGLWGPNVITSVSRFAAARAEVAKGGSPEALAIMPISIPSRATQSVLFADLASDGEHAEMLLCCTLPRQEGRESRLMPESSALTEGLGDFRCTWHDGGKWWELTLWRRTDWKRSN